MQFILGESLSSKASPRTLELMSIILFQFMNSISCFEWLGFIPPPSGDPPSLVGWPAWGLDALFDLIRALPMRKFLYILLRWVRKDWMQGKGCSRQPILLKWRTKLCLRWWLSY
jgi:hypothetical protein